MKPGSTMRVARPTDNLATLAEMYVKGLGFVMLAELKITAVLTVLSSVIPDSVTISNSRLNENT